MSDDPRRDSDPPRLLEQRAMLLPRAPHDSIRPTDSAVRDGAVRDGAVHDAGVRHGAGEGPATESTAPEIVVHGPHSQPQQRHPAARLPDLARSHGKLAAASTMDHDAYRPQYRAQGLPRRPQGSRRAARPVSPVTQAAITMLMLAATLASARFLVPSIIEESRYAWRRGQLRAEYEESAGGLRNVGMDALANAYQMVIQRVGPSVVHIEVQREEAGLGYGMNIIRHGEPLDHVIRDQGSGVIIDDAGLILTNNHVIADGRRISVGLSDGRRVEAELVGSDPLTDLALLRIDAPDLMPIEWGDSDASEVGTPVWAIGSPFGLDRTVTFGILSGKHRAAKAGTSYQDFMQSDVAVNPGNSGGPLVDSQGRLIGINTAIVGDTYRGVSFSIPSNVARVVSERLRSEGRFQRGWLGVELATTLADPTLAAAASADATTGEIAPAQGAKISRLADPASPAALAGLAAGDIIVRFDGREVTDREALIRMVGNWPAGQAVQVEFLRDGHLHTVAVDIGMRPEQYNIVPR